MSDLICRDLCMTFQDATSGARVEALKNINFELKQGEILTVLGPSGCGKTTLLNMIAGFLVPTSGALTLGDVDIDGPGAERGMVFQQGALFEWLTVARNVDFGLRMRGEDSASSAEKVSNWLDTVGLHGFRRHADLSAVRRHAAARGAGALPCQRSFADPDGRAARRA